MKFKKLKSGYYYIQDSRIVEYYTSYNVFDYLI